MSNLPQYARSARIVRACKSILSEGQRLTFLTEPSHAETRKLAILYLTGEDVPKRDSSLVKLEDAVARASRLHTLSDKSMLPDALNAWVAAVAATENVEQAELTLRDDILTYEKRRWVLSRCYAKFESVVRWSPNVRPLKGDRRFKVNRLLLSYKYEGVEYRHSLEVSVTVPQDEAEQEIKPKIKVLHPSYRP